MLLFVLALVFLATLALIFVRQKQIGRLSSFALLLATVMLMIWMQDRGLLPNPRGAPASEAVWEPAARGP